MNLFLLIGLLCGLFESLFPKNIQKNKEMGDQITYEVRFTMHFVGIIGLGFVIFSCFIICTKYKSNRSIFHSFIWGTN